KSCAEKKCWRKDTANGARTDCSAGGNQLGTKQTCQHQKWKARIKLLVQNPVRDDEAISPDAWIRECDDTNDKPAERKPQINWQAHILKKFLAVIQHFQKNRPQCATEN